MGKCTYCTPTLNLSPYGPVWGPPGPPGPPSEQQSRRVGLAQRKLAPERARLAVRGWSEDSGLAVVPGLERSPSIGFFEREHGLLGSHKPVRDAMNFHTIQGAARYRATPDLPKQVAKALGAGQSAVPG